MYLAILDHIRNRGFESDHFFDVEENLKNFSDDSVYVTWFGLSPRAKFGPGLGLNASLGNLSGSLAQNPTNLRIWSKIFRRKFSENFRNFTKSPKYNVGYISWRVLKYEYLVSKNLGKDGKIIKPKDPPPPKRGQPGNLRHFFLAIKIRKNLIQRQIFVSKIPSPESRQKNQNLIKFFNFLKVKNKNRCL